MKTTLLIMAAGLGSRFGGGIKQLEPIGSNGEIIMDYSIHDAIEAGFNKIVFVIRKDIEDDFRERIGTRVEAVCKAQGVEIAYAYQDMNNVPGDVPTGRTKPWGTGQAVLSAKNIIHEPFVVINADDYYGKAAFVRIHDWLELDHNDSALCMAGFILKNTLSDNGGVTRAICKVEQGHSHIVDVTETGNIIKSVDPMTGNECVKADGLELDPEFYVSMNMWGFPAKKNSDPAFMTVLEDNFRDFFEKDVPENELNAEYLLPTLIGGLLKDGKCTVKILETKDKWFGVTYKEDKESVVNSFKELIESGVYNADLYSDLL